MIVTRKHAVERVGKRAVPVSAPVPDPVTVHAGSTWRIVARHCPAVERVVFDIHRAGEHPDPGFATLEIAQAYAVEAYGADAEGEVI